MWFFFVALKIKIEKRVVRSGKIFQNVHNGCLAVKSVLINCIFSILYK